MTKVLADMPNKETMSSIYEAIADMSDHHLKVASSYEELEKILDERSMKMSEEESKVNNRIKALRIRAGLDQQSLAEYCGTSKTTISNLEKGIADPRISVVKILANVLGVSIEYLMGWASADELNAVQVKQKNDYLKRKLYVYGRELDLVTARCNGAAKLMNEFEKNMKLDNGYIKDLEGEQDEDQD